MDKPMPCDSMRYSSWLKVASRNPPAALQFATNRLRRTARIRLLENPWLYELMDQYLQRRARRSLMLQKVLDPGIFTDNNAEAHDVPTHELTILGKTINLGDNVDWLADFEGGEWPNLLSHKYHRILTHDFSQAEYRKHGDIKRVWDLNKHSHFVDLAKAFRASLDPKYQTMMMKQFLDWNQRFPYMHGIGWQQPLIVAQRAINWIICYTLDAFPEPLHMTLATSLFYHGKYLTENLEMSYTGNNSNHLIGDLAALHLIGLTLKKRKWARNSLEMLLNEVRKQIYKDGVDYEQSSGYHRYVLEFLTLVWYANKRQPDFLTDTISRMSGFLNDIAWGDGTLPFLSDWDGAKVWVRDHHRPVELYRLGRKSSGSAAYHDAGYYVMKGGPFRVIFDCGPIGMGGKELATHGHSDLLSFTMSVEGEPFITDPGSGTYTESREIRNYMRSTSGHNTITIDDRDQCGLVGTWAVEKHPKPILIKWQVGQDVDVVSGEHDGYRPVVHRREIQLLKKPKFIVRICDDILGDSAHSYQCRFHLSPGIICDIDSAIVRLASRRSRLTMKFDPTLTVRQDRGWFAPDYGKWIEAPVLAFRGRSALPTRIVWEYVLSS